MVDPTEVEVDLGPELIPDAMMQEDGSAVVSIGNQPEVGDDHFRNLIEEVSPKKLSEISRSLLDSIGRDKEDRKGRDEQYADGIKRTGLGNDAPGGASFSGASKTVHPMLAEGCVDFAARAIKEIWPPNGPCKSKIEGVKDKESIARADRVSSFMNWQMTRQMPEARSDVEKMLSQLPLGGSQYLKMRFDGIKRRPAMEFVPIDDLFLPFLAANFLSAERRTHRQVLTKEEYQRRVRSGMYVEIDLVDPALPEGSEAKQATDKVEGVGASENEDGGRVLFEVQCWLAIEAKEGEEADENPKAYIITIDEQSNKAVALYRDWRPEDPSENEMMWMVEFPFIPWRGAYAIGLAHLIGSLSGSATGAVRAILDSALLQNAMTLLKLKSPGKGETLNLQIGQVNEIDVGLVDDIRKVLMPVPFNPPSQALFQMLGFLVDTGKGVVQTSFEKLADMRQDAPVGTTLALIEQGMIVFSAIHARMHAAMGQVLEILYRINQMNFVVPADYAGEITEADFQGPMVVIPVSDPHVFSDTQRFAQVQAVMERAAAKPQLYKERDVEEMFLRQLKIRPEDVLVKKETPENMDPASENVAMVMGSPVFVLPPQDHVGHLLVHCPFAMSPAFGNPVMLQTMGVPMVGHLRDHILQYYLKETHEGVTMATKQNLISADNAHQQAEAIVRVQAEAEDIMQPFVKVLQMMAQKVQEMMTPPQGQNPLLQKAQLDAQTKTETEKLRDARERELEQEREAGENMRTDKKIASDERRNDQDNTTAKAIVAAEIMSDEHTNLRTGTGINPGN